MPSHPDPDTIVVELPGEERRSTTPFSLDGDTIVVEMPGEEGRSNTPSNLDEDTIVVEVPGENRLSKTRSHPDPETMVVEMARETDLSLLNLPLEIVRKIINMCSGRREVRSLRLTNRFLCQLTSARLFENITISYLPHALKGLEKIAASDFWRHQVRNIKWVYLGKDDAVMEGCYANRDPLSTGGWALDDPWLNKQLELISRLPNIETVHLRSSWEKAERFHGQVRYDGHAFDIIFEAYLRPMVVWTEENRTKFWHDSAGFQLAVKTVGSPPEGTKPEDPIQIPTSYFVKRIVLQKLFVRTSEALSLLQSYPRLGFLKFENVRMGGEDRSEDPKTPIKTFLDQIRRSYHYNLAPPPRVRLSGITAMTPHVGEFHATEDELKEWREGNEDGPLIARMNRVMTSKHLTRYAVRTGMVDRWEKDFMEEPKDHYRLDYESSDDEEFGTFP